LFSSANYSKCLVKFSDRKDPPIRNVSGAFGRW
jgi:hypothetical protein